MAALAGFGAPVEAKPPKAPPALYPKFVVDEPGDFPCLKSPPLDKNAKALIMLQRNLRVLYKTSPFYTKPASQETDVERYSDALKRDEEAMLESFLHTRSVYLPRQLRAEPLATTAYSENGADGVLMELEDALREVPVLSFLPTAGMPSELADFGAPSPAKRKRLEGKESLKSQQKKRQKMEETVAKKKEAREQPELDFSNLTKHKLVELRDFCREKGITVSSRNKQGYADAIVAWKQKQPAPRPAAPAPAPAAPKAKETEIRGTVALKKGPLGSEKGKEKEEEASEKAGEAEANGGKLPRPLDRMSRLAQLEEELAEDGDENQERNKSRLADDDEEEDENDYNERYGSDAEEDGDGDEDDEPTF